MNKKNIFEYLKTILWTILATFVVLFIIFWTIFNQFNEENIKKQPKDKAPDTYTVTLLIDEQKYKEERSPENYRINLKLGELYELKKDYKNAEFEYKKAISKAPYNEFKPVYKLALLYLNSDCLTEAQTLIDKIRERPNKKLINFKAEIYSNLGDKYYEKGNYEEASFKYQKALFYYKIIKSKKIKNLNGNLASAYIYLAEEKLNEMKLDEAVNYLKKADAIIGAPIIKYKLALILSKKDPLSAFQYFEKVFKAEPKIINYEEYYKFLSDLALNAEAQGQNTKAELYKLKIKKLKDYYNSNLLSVEDICINNINGEIRLNNWRKKYNINLEFTLKNTSKYNINSLFIEIIFKDKDEIIDTYSKKIINSKSKLKPGEQSPIIHIKTSTRKIDSDKLSKQLKAQIYASKSEDSYNILLKDLDIKEVVKNNEGFKKVLPKFFLPHS